VTASLLQSVKVGGGRRDAERRNRWLEAEFAVREHVGA